MKGTVEGSQMRSSPGCDLWMTSSTPVVFTSPQVIRGHGKDCQHHVQKKFGLEFDIVTQILYNRNVDNYLYKQEKTYPDRISKSPTNETKK